MRKLKDIFNTVTLDDVLYNMELTGKMDDRLNVSYIYYPYIDVLYLYYLVDKKYLKYLDKCNTVYGKVELLGKITTLKRSISVGLPNVRIDNTNNENTEIADDIHTSVDFMNHITDKHLIKHSYDVIKNNKKQTKTFYTFDLRMIDKRFKDAEKHYIVNPKEDKARYILTTDILTDNTDNIPLIIKEIEFVTELMYNLQTSLNTINNKITEFVNQKKEHKEIINKDYEKIYMCKTKYAMSLLLQMYENPFTIEFNGRIYPAKMDSKKIFKKISNTGGYEAAVKTMSNKDIKLLNNITNNEYKSLLLLVYGELYTLDVLRKYIIKNEDTKEIQSQLIDDYLCGVLTDEGHSKVTLYSVNAYSLLLNDVKSKDDYIYKFINMMYTETECNKGNILPSVYMTSWTHSPKHYRIQNEDNIKHIITDAELMCRLLETYKDSEMLTIADNIRRSFTGQYTKYYINKQAYTDIRWLSVDERFVDSFTKVYEYLKNTKMKHEIFDIMYSMLQASLSIYTDYNIKGLDDETKISVLNKISEYTDRFISYLQKHLKSDVFKEFINKYELLFLLSDIEDINNIINDVKQTKLEDIIHEIKKQESYRAILNQSDIEEIIHQKIKNKINIFYPDLNTKLIY